MGVVMVCDYGGDRGCDDLGDAVAVCEGFADEGKGEVGSWGGFRSGGTVSYLFLWERRVVGDWEGC